MEILPGVHRVGNALSTAYLLVDGSGVTVIDSGPARFDQTILRALAAIGRQPGDVRRIILTHRHFDHMGGAAALRAATGAPVSAHPLDAPQIDGRERNRLPRGIVGVLMGVVVPLTMPIHPCPVDDMLVEGQGFDLGDLGELQVIHTPGHTVGHCSLHLPARRLLILGDALNNFAGRPSVPGAVVNDDTDQARRTAVLLGHMDMDALVFGHGAPILRDGALALEAAAKKASAAAR